MRKESSDEAGKKKREDVDAQLFNNMELLFRKKGDDKAPLKTLRHVAWNSFKLGRGDTR